jgi:hypothetical protein
MRPSTTVLPTQLYTHETQHHSTTNNRRNRCHHWRAPTQLYTHETQHHSTVTTGEHQHNFTPMTPSTTVLSPLESTNTTLHPWHPAPQHCHHWRAPTQKSQLSYSIDTEWCHSFFTSASRWKGCPSWVDWSDTLPDRHMWRLVQSCTPSLPSSPKLRFQKKLGQLNMSEITIRFTLTKASCII